MCRQLDGRHMNRRDRESGFTRRRFGAAAGCTFVSVALGDACAVFTTATETHDPRLTARPRPDIRTSLENGPLGLSARERDALIRIPSAPARRPRCHCSSSSTARRRTGRACYAGSGPAADQAGVVVLAPDSRGTTWDAIRGSFGEDVVFLNRALEHVFAHVAVDPARVGVGGFSDGASYALSLGLANGDLFSRIVALLAGVRHPHGSQRAPARLHLARHGRPDPADRAVQPGHRAAPARAGPRRHVPRIRRPSRGAASGRGRGAAMDGGALARVIGASACRGVGIARVGGASDSAARFLGSLELRDDDAARAATRIRRARDVEAEEAERYERQTSERQASTNNTAGPDWWDPGTRHLTGRRRR